MNFLVSTLLVTLLVINYVKCGQYGAVSGADYVSIPNSLLHDYISRFDNNAQQQFQSQQQQDNSMDLMMLPKDSLAQSLLYSDYNNYRIRKDLSTNGIKDQSNELINHFQTRDDILLPREPVPRKEYLEHSSLYGHQYVQGGAGEGQQHLKPDGSIQNVQVIKSDSVLPAYCNPPNPCPNGYTSEDGCIEDFENSADFSKEYQSSQECMCDSEHMFNCPGNSDENELETLARSIQNEGLTLDNTLDHIMQTMDNNNGNNNNNNNNNKHKVVAKKYFIKRSGKSIVKRSINEANGKSYKQNPFLMGEKLPVVAKKAPHTSGRL